jgi:nucleoside-diphosphate-sugar epimerase
VTGTLFCFGLGYTATAVAEALLEDGWQIRGTVRSLDAKTALTSAGIAAILFDDSIGEDFFDGVTHILSSVPPSTDGKYGADPVLVRYRNEIAGCAATIKWAGYLSTTGVYGNQNGARVDETTQLRPTSERARARVAAEEAWQEIGRTASLPVHIFRLAGIYGPRRNALETVRSGRARRIVKPGQVFSRIHVIDIVAVLRASMEVPRAGAIYNVCDDEAAPPQDVIARACALLNHPLPPEEAFDSAEMTDMTRSFYADSKTVDNGLIHRELGIRLAYPTFREGLARLYKDMKEAP